MSLLASILFDWSVWRWVNLIGSVLVVIILTMGAVARWPKMPLRFKRIAPWVIATYVVIAYGSGEALANDVEPGYRILLMSCVLFGLIGALLFGMGDADYRQGSIRQEIRDFARYVMSRRRVSR